jgi:nucleoside-diphosphate-sugar epimerase
LQNVLVTGGAGYVGSVLVPALLERGHRVRVLDLYLFGDDVLAGVAANPRLEQIRGDIRDRDLLDKLLPGCDSVIHLACISNDPSFELDPELGRSINFDAFEPLVDAARGARVGRFVYASSSSVYGVKDHPDVDENDSLEPLTDYSRYKALCEEVLLERAGRELTPVIVRPATVCGYSPRQRLDVVVNILTNHAVNSGMIQVFGGDQMRPNIHIQDMVELYLLLLELPAERIARRVYNAGGPNHTVEELAEKVRRTVARRDVEVRRVPTNDPRSYHIASKRLAAELGFRARRTIEQAVRELEAALLDGRLPDALSDPRYFNVKQLQACGLR